MNRLAAGLLVLGMVGLAEPRAVRIGRGPIITPDLDPGIGDNINGPSLIRVPGWVKRPLGKYYLYFAAHNGKYIRMAYSNRVEGPWKVHGPGVLRLEEVKSIFGHIASPDVHVDEQRKEIRMYFHGPARRDGKNLGQMTLAALSSDGLQFTAGDEILGPSYFRVFQWGGYYYAIARAGETFRSRDGLTPFEKGPTLFSADPKYTARHFALKLDGDDLSAYYSRIGDSPEHIMISHIRLTEDWQKWKPASPEAVLAPERDYEGSALPVEASKSGRSKVPVHQLRDPAIYREGRKTYFLYSVAGESGIGLAQFRR
ncbi:MAG: hypothetical protein NTY38_20135 [Acidobacteria bacterium]|nr:hypothetical protein [Acidobacteriota bacterium]